MSAFLNIEGVIDQARALVEDIKTEPITIQEARILISQIRAAEGWLQSARTLLNPTELLQKGNE